MKNKILRKAMLAATALSVVLVPLQQAAACTSFLLHAQDGGYAYGRTMEFGLPLHSNLMIVPRNLPVAATGPDGQAGTGLTWTTRYAATGANVFGKPLFIDGLNEAGLAGGGLYLPGLAEYQDVAPGEAKTSLAAHDLLTYILTSFATVAEVKAALPKIKVNRAALAELKMAAPIHLTLHDAGGNNLVVEYIGGQLHMHDNPTTVLTNAPAFDWHIANLGNYLNLSAYDPKPLKVGALTISPPSTGSGAVGLPGDMSSPSRFVRAFNYWRAAPEQKTSAEAVDLAFHILNNFDISPGIIRTQADSQAGGGVAGIETTEWTAVSDLKAKRYYIRTYGNNQTRVIDLSKAKLDAKEVVYFPLDQPQQMIELVK